MELEDPRESPLHPRFAEQLVGHEGAIAKFRAAQNIGRLHHAWLMSGPQGIGKATLAYMLARELLDTETTTSAPLIAARSHPDLFVLQRAMGETKTAKLKSEIAVGNSRDFGSFFSRTAAIAKMRVAIIDSADDLNIQSANALLKVLEEPPANCMIFLLCHQPGTILRTIRSRCVKLELDALTSFQVDSVFNQTRFAGIIGADGLDLAKKLGDGSPGRALALLNSDAMKAFGLVSRSQIQRPEGRLAVINAFRDRAVTLDDFELFTDLLLTWLAKDALNNPHPAAVSEAYNSIQSQTKKTVAFNLDRKLAILESLVIADQALKAA